MQNLVIKLSEKEMKFVEEMVQKGRASSPIALIQQAVKEMYLADKSFRKAA